MRKTPRYVRIKEPLPGEEGRLLMLSEENGECRIGLRDGSIRSFEPDEIRDVHVREVVKEWIRTAIGKHGPIVFSSAFVVWTFFVGWHFGWRAAALSFMASIAAVLWDRVRGV